MIRTTLARSGVAGLGALALAVVPAAGALASPAAAPSMIGRWHYVSGPAGALDPGQDWLVDVSQATDGRLVGTIVTSTYTSGPCAVGGTIWQGLSPSAAGVWAGQQSMCDGTYVPTTFYGSETGRLFESTSDGTGWWLEPVPAT